MEVNNEVRKESRLFHFTNTIGSPQEHRFKQQDSVDDNSILMFPYEIFFYCHKTEHLVFLRIMCATSNLCQAKIVDDYS